MTDRLLDECYSCIIASLHLIKSVASQSDVNAASLIEGAADLSQTAISCIRSYEAGSVLPETLDRMAEESQHLLEVIKVSALESSELTACSVACDNFVRTYQQSV